MKKVILFAFMLSLGTATAQELKEKVLFTVEDDTVTAEEYMAVYNKNRNLGEDIDPKTPREYLDLYVNFKLKVHEAKEMGMDTMPSFLREYRSYRDQLAKPYLNDKDVTEELVKEAYERMKYDVRASHIMVKVPENAPPEDTLEAYNRIMSIKEKIDGGAFFDQIAGEYSEDTYSAKRGGDLGYFTVFNMVYPFETAAYQTDIGMMTGPVRTKHGYHLIKTTDKRPARGQVSVAHIMLIANDKSTAEEKANAKQKIEEIYQQLQEGADFATLAKQYSEDKTSAEKGGKLPPFGINKMFEEFEDAAFNLEEEGDISKPIKTPVGWHLIKLLGKTGVPTWEQAKNDLKSQVQKDSRSQQSRISILKKLKKEYSYEEYPKALEKAFEQLDESFLSGDYRAGSIQSEDQTLFELANKEYSIGDFLRHLEQLKGSKNGKLYPEFRKAYEEFVESELIAYEKTRLVEKYPEFRLLSREYFEGILLFDLTEEKVWKKSVNDSTGLRNYYADHSDEYRWKERYQAVIVDANSKKMAKKAKKLLKKGRTVSEIEEELNADSQLNVKLDSNLYEKGNHTILKMMGEKETGFSDLMEKDGHFFVVQIEKIVPPGGKSFEEARGAVISDYQTHLEEEWIKELKGKYEVDINKDVLKEVIAELESQS